MNGSNVQPSVWYYGLAVLVILIGFLAFAGFIYSGVSNIESGLVQMTAPGNADLDLKEPGEYTLFYENHSFFNGSIFNTAEQIPALQIRVSEKASGQTLATYPASGSTYSMGGRTGRSVMAFKVEKPGVYRINASYPKEPGPEVVLAVGKGFIDGIFYFIFAAVALLFGSIAVAAIISYITYSRRKKALLSQKEEERLIRGGQ
jgi:hypothetical protein